MNKGIVRQVLIILATIATITVNVLSNALPINNQDAGEISDKYPALFTPAGYVFSIWGLIYLALLAFTIYQALPGQRDNPIFSRIAYFYLLSSAANIAWLFLWHYEILDLTLLAMFTLLGALIVIYIRLDIGLATVSTAEKWLVHLPFSIYLGWITVATVANVSVVLYDSGWGGWGIAPEIWTAIVLGVATVIAGIMSATRADVAYALVLVWAFVGILSKHRDLPVIATSAGIAAALVALMAILSALPRGPLPIGSK